MSNCNHDFGCHSCVEILLQLHKTIKHELSMPTANHERIREGYVSVKRFIEDIVGVGETENGDLE